jgi:hypothetical protein
LLLLLPTLLLVSGTIGAQSTSGKPTWTDPEREEFLRSAKVVKRKPTSKGITGVEHAWMKQGDREHEAALSYIDESKPRFETAMGTEINFRDSWKYNVAAYRMDRLLGLNMVPTTAVRKLGGRTGSACWWVEEVQFDEGERIKKKVGPPNLDEWNKQMWMVRVFDQLIYNIDRNLGNLVIDKEWRIWMIDHSRAFRLSEDLREAKNLEKCERGLLAKLKALDEATLERELKEVLNKGEIRGLLKRRDKIVALFESKGDSVMYDMPMRQP